MGPEGRFSRWAEEGAFELSFDAGEAALRVQAGEDVSQLSQFTHWGQSLGEGRCGSVWCTARAEGLIQPQRGALHPASGNFGGPLPHLFLVKWKLGTWAQLL